MDADEVQFAWSRRLEKCGMLQLVLSFLTQVSGDLSFPSYNILLGFWCCYCSWARNIRSVFTYVAFTTLSVVLDIAFMSTWGSSGDNWFRESGTASQFALVMMIFNLFTKLWSLWGGAHLWGALGGGRAMEADAPGRMLDSYSSLPEQMNPGSRNTDGVYAGSYGKPMTDGYGDAGVDESVIRAEV